MTSDWNRLQSWQLLLMLGGMQMCHPHKEKHADGSVVDAIHERSGAHLANQMLLLLLSIHLAGGGIVQFVRAMASSYHLLHRRAPHACMLAGPLVQHCCLLSAVARKCTRMIQTLMLHCVSHECDSCDTS